MLCNKTYQETCNFLHLVIYFVNDLKIRQTNKLFYMNQINYSVTTDFSHPSSGSAVYRFFEVLSCSSPFPQVKQPFPMLENEHACSFSSIPSKYELMHRKSLQFIKNWKSIKAYNKYIIKYNNQGNWHIIWFQKFYEYLTLRHIKLKLRYSTFNQWSR